MELSPGNLILGFNNGLQLMQGSNTRTLYKDNNPPGSPNRRIVNFSRDQSGNIWFAANWAGVGRFNFKTGQINFFAGPPDFNVSSVEVDGDSLLIVFHTSLK